MLGLIELRADAILLSLIADGRQLSEFFPLLPSARAPCRLIVKRSSAPTAHTHDSIGKLSTDRRPLILRARGSLDSGSLLPLKQKVDRVALPMRPRRSPLIKVTGVLFRVCAHTNFLSTSMIRSDLVRQSLERVNSMQHVV